MKLKSHLLAASLLVSVPAWTLPALAADDVARPKPGATEVEVVTVTARRVSEDAQKAAVAVTAVTPLQLEQMHPHDLSDLNHIAPNFTILPSGSIFRTSANGFARGIGYNNIDGTLDPALGISVDGVFYQRNVGVLQNMFDLSGVEVVLGPQGTLYGKNTIAGVLNVTTQKPNLDSWEEKGWVRFGNLGRIDSEVVANIPLDDTLAFRFAFQSQYAQGPYNNINTTGGLPSAERHPGGDDTKTFRPSLRWVPGDAFEFTVVGNVLRNTSPSVGGTNVAPPGYLASFFLGHPGYGFAGGPTSIYTVDRTWPSGDYFNMDSITLDARYHGNGFDIISLSNYLHDWTPLNYDDFSYAGLLNNYAIVGHRQHSEELRAQSTGAGPLQWVGGVFYDTGYYDYWQSFYNFIPVLFGAPSPTVTNQWIFQWQHSLSGFGQVDYSVTDKLQLTAGIRYTSASKRALNYAGFVHATTRDLSLWPADNIVSGSKTWDHATYHLSAKYQFTDDLMSYVSYSTGFLSGGFNSAAQAGTGVSPGVTAATLGPWAPETAKSFEAGIKSNWFAHRLELNLTGFWTRYDDLQSFNQFVIDPNIGLNAVGPANTGAERARGLELQAVAVPVAGLHLGATVGYLDAAYTSFKTFRNGIPVDCVAIRCIPVLSPKWNGRLDASYDVDSSVGIFTPTVAYTWSSSYFQDTFNDPFGHQPAYGTLDVAVNFQSEDGKWGVSVYGKNVTDTRYFLSFLNVPGVAATRYYADPATFGVELHVSLDQPG